MKARICILIGMVFSLTILFAGCEQDDLLSKMKEMVPVFEGAQILESKVADEKMGIIMMEVDASKVKQKEIFDFYKENMVKNGWKLNSFKDYGKNGSVMELVKKDFGTLSVVTIMKKVDKTGKIPVTLNLTIM